MRKLRQAICLLLLLLTSVLFLGCSKKEPYFLKVLDYPVEKEEYAIWAYDNISKVAVEFTHKYGADANEAGFWQKDFGEGSPIDRLKELTNEVMIKEKGNQILAKKYGIIEDISYEAFLNAFAEENRIRQEKAANNEVVYGPQQLTLNQYYSYRQGQIDTFLKQYIEAEIIKVDEKKLRDFYITLDQKESQKNFKADLFYCVWKNSLEEEIRDQLEQRIVMLNEAGELNEEGLKAISDEMQQVLWGTAAIDTLELGKENLEYDKIVSVVSEVDPEDLSERFSIRSGYEGIVKVLSKEYEAFGTYEENRVYVEQVYRSEKALEFMEAENKTLKITEGELFGKLTYEDIVKQ